jgi:GrpB-like predicted nucleotidyltransferase (UPF0157 family)
MGACRIASLIREYDPIWPDRFAAIAATVQRALGNVVLRIEHIGSTAVPGLAAKPVIDLDVVVSGTDIPEAIKRLADLGYVHEGNLGVPGREAFRSSAGEDQHHLYVLVEGARELKRHLAFRDALRADPVLRAAYSTLKRALAAQHADDRVAYSRGKTDFVLATLAAGGFATIAELPQSNHRECQ